jgi:hypothetical protein
MWVAMAIGFASQSYFVRELVAAFALFVLCCAVVGLAIACLYGLVKGWEMVVTRLAFSHRAILPIAAVKGDAQRTA